MFTAVFCSRVVFDIWERKGWLKSLHMMRVPEGDPPPEFLRRLQELMSGRRL